LQDLKSGAGEGWRWPFGLGKTK